VFLQGDGKSQAPIHEQVAVYLRRMSSNGSNWEVATMFGISEGSLVNYWNCVSEAVRALGKEYICWPKDEYRNSIHRGFQSIAGFPNAIECMDGVHFPLYEASDTSSKDSYFSRKNRYAIAMQAIVDHQRHFTSYDIGWSAVSHDARIYEPSDFFENKGTLLEGEDYYYLLGDSAYPLSTTLTPLFKCHHNCSI
jgi:hypothetical protein